MTRQQRPRGLSFTLFWWMSSTPNSTQLEAENKGQMMRVNSGLTKSTGRIPTWRLRWQKMKTAVMIWQACLRNAQGCGGTSAPYVPKGLTRVNGRVANLFEP